MTSKKQLIDDLHRVRVNAKHHFDIQTALRAIKFLEGLPDEPLAALDARLDGVKREMATNLYSRAAAVLRAYAQDAGDDHSVGICNCPDIALVDELDTAARASQPPPAPLADLMPAMCHGGNLSNGTMLLTVWAPIDYPIVVGGNYLVSITPVTKSGDANG